MSFAPSRDLPAIGEPVREGNLVVTRLGPGQIEYSSVAPFSGDWMLAIVGEHLDHFGLFGPTRFIRDLPIPADAEPRWSRTDENVLYYLSRNSIHSHNVLTGEDVKIRTFDQYNYIVGGGEGDLQNSLFAFCGDGWSLFTYNLERDRQSRQIGIGTGWILDGLYATQSDNVVVSWKNRGTGIDLYDRDMKKIREIVPASGHHDVGHFKGRDVMAWANADENPEPEVEKNAVMLVDLETGDKTPLLVMGWNKHDGVSIAPLACHVSCCETGVLISTYSPENPEPGTPGWTEYTNSLIMVSYTGEGLWQIPHNSQWRSYSSEPKASASRKGDKAAFSSNWGQFPDNPNFTEVFTIEDQSERRGTGTATTSKRGRRRAA